jgi:hypothetical protein
MKKEKSTSMENVEDKSRAKKTPGKAKKTRKQTESVRLPFLLELIYTLSTIILILLALIIMITSFLAGASLLVIVLRTGVAITVIGSILMLIASQISSGLLFSVRVDQEEEQRKQEEAQSMSNEDLNQTEA